MLFVLADDTPEVNEEYIIFLSNVQTFGVSDTGAATLDPRGSTASITVQASDEPHGVFNFAPGSDYVVTQEADITLQIYVERKFGSIGMLTFCDKFCFISKISTCQYEYILSLLENMSHVRVLDAILS